MGVVVTGAVPVGGTTCSLSGARCTAGLVSCGVRVERRLGVAEVGVVDIFSSMAIVEKRETDRETESFSKEAGSIW